jgi:hypothetical protein
MCKNHCFSVYVCVRERERVHVFVFVYGCVFVLVFLNLIVCRRVVCRQKDALPRRSFKIIIKITNSLY